VDYKGSGFFARSEPSVLETWQVIEVGPEVKRYFVCKRWDHHADQNILGFESAGDASLVNCAPWSVL